MADIRAFRGFRYDLGRVGTLSDVIAPPYDVIDATLQQQLYARSPYNVVRLILNKEEPSDDVGVVSKLWPVTEQHVVSLVTGLMGPRPIFIADGHHRYETALRYLEERREAGEVHDDEAPANFVLMMLVSMSDPGLVILPTHRLVSGVGDLTAEQLRPVLEP